VVVGGEESGVEWVEWKAMDEYVMGCLDVERFLDFGVRCQQEVEEDKSWEEDSEDGVCGILLVVIR
jgi:hypothetical protein